MHSSRWKLIVLAFYLLFPFASPAEQAASRPLRVGVILALHAGGIFTTLSLEMKKGIEMALAESDSYPMKIVYEDDGGAIPKDAITATQTLLSKEKVDVVLNWGYSTQPVIAPLCNKAKVPCIVIWDSNNEAFTLGEYNFSVGVATEASAANIANFCYRDRERRRVAIIGVSDHWSELIVKSFEERFKELGGKVVMNEMVKGDTSDLRSLILRAKQANADSLFLPLYANTMYAAIRQARVLRFAGELFTGDSIFESDLMELGDVSNGVFSSQLWISDPTFHNLYEKHSGRRTTPVSVMQAALAYDAVRFLSQVAKSVSKKSAISPASMREGIASTTFLGVTGPIGIRDSLQKVEIPVVADSGKFQLVGSPLVRK